VTGRLTKSKSCNIKQATRKLERLARMPAVRLCVTHVRMRRVSEGAARHGEKGPSRKIHMVLVTQEL
jgi:hypothetical protein